MIAKRIGIKSQLMSGASFAAGSQKVRDYGWTLAKYVAGLTLDHDDLERLHELGQMGRYPVNDKGDEDRIRDPRSTDHAPSSTSLCPIAKAPYLSKWPNVIAIHSYASWALKTVQAFTGFMEIPHVRIFTLLSTHMI